MPVLEVDESRRPAVISAVPARRTGVVAGLVAGAIAVTIGMLVAGIISVTSPIDAVGSTFIDHVPAWLKSLAISWFGTNDKVALRVGIIVILAIAAGALGIASRRRPVVGSVGIAVFGIVGMLAALNRRNEPASTFLPSLLGAVVGAIVLRRLLQPAPTGPKATPHRSRVPLGWDRRRFIVASGAATAVAVVAGAAAQV